MIFLVYFSPAVSSHKRHLGFESIRRQLDSKGILQLGRGGSTVMNNDKYFPKVKFSSDRVSRSHAEISVDESNKTLLLKHVSQSTTTMITRGKRNFELGRGKTEPIEDGDIVQFGNCPGDEQDERRKCLRMKISIIPFDPSIVTGSYFRCHHGPPPEKEEDLSVCYICLCAIAPQQALFTAGCSHTAHFFCIRKYLQKADFLCPLCRGITLLDTEIVVEGKNLIKGYEEYNDTHTPCISASYPSEH